MSATPLRTLYPDCRRFAVLPLVAMDDFGAPVPPDEIHRVPVASYDPAEGDDPMVSLWGVYSESAEGQVMHVADCPTQAVAEAVAAALNESLPKPPVPKDSFVLTVMPGYVPVRGSAKTDLLYAIEQAGIPTCVEDHQ